MIRMKRIDTKIRHATPANGNIFAELGFKPGEAAALLAEADRIIDSEAKQKKRDKSQRKTTKINSRNLWTRSEKGLDFTYIFP